MQFAEERIQREVEEHAQRVRAAEKAAAAAEEALKVGQGGGHGIWHAAAAWSLLPVVRVVGDQRGKQGAGLLYWGCCTDLVSLRQAASRAFLGAVLVQGLPAPGPAPSMSWGQIPQQGCEFS